MPAVKGLEIRKRRRQAGLKLSELARAARMPPKTLANIEGGQIASIEIVYRLAAALDAEAEDFLVNAGDAA